MTEFLFFPRLSRRVEICPGAKRSTHTSNLIYTIARSMAHPINYPGNAKGVPGIACGVSWVRIETLLGLTGRTWATLKRNLRVGQEFGFWRSAEVGNGFVKFSLRAPGRVAAGLGLETVGGYAFVAAIDFPDLHLLATELVAEGYQKTCFKAARAEARRQKKKIQNPEVLTGASKSEKPGSLKFFGSRWVLVPSGQQVYGISQKRIAELLGKAEVTVRRHLSHRYRRRRRLRPLQKKQQAIETNLTKAQLALAQTKKAQEAHRYFTEGERVYYAYVNIYAPVWETRGRAKRETRRARKARKG